jgi:hypothetical protein
MEIGKNFGIYWLAGLIFLGIAGIVQWLATYLNTAMNLSFQPINVWSLIIGLIVILIVIFVPWIYGHLIEWIYNELILKKRKNK